MSGIPAGAGSLLGKRLGKYEILALLALGGTAEIYLARIGGAAGFEKYVVVKCLHDHLADDSDFVKMFLDEARLAAVLDHSNIVQTFELGEHENRYYMVMEFLAGLSLAMVVRRGNERLQGGKLPVPLILNIAAQACAGLHYAHDRQANNKPLNMVHRDISPQNLVISFEGVVKVVDFGIARAELRETKTKAGTIKGKFAYMSPEQCVATNVDRRTDVFALGVIVHELLTGRRLFKRNSPYETYQAVIECAVDPPSAVNHELDPALDAVVMRAIAKDKDERYPTAEAFGDAMQGYLHHRGKGSGPGEVGKFFEQYFGQEIEEHGERMRELISGRDISVDTGVNWGEAEEERRANETLDLTRGLRRENVQDAESKDILIVRASEAAGSQLAIEDEGSRANDDDEMPAEKTRIETNPLDNLKELDLASGGLTPVPPGSVTGGPAPLPAPPTAPLPAAKRFPDLANLATVVGDENKAPELAKTELGQPVDPNHGAEIAPSASGSNVSRANPYSTTHDAVSQSQIEAAVQAMEQRQQQQPVQPTGGSPYPVVSGRPFSSELAPSNPPSPQRSSYQPSPQQAANLMSPVGDQYPHAVDWEVAAARPAKAIPPWMLAVLFASALVAALLVTIVIARIIR